MGAKKALIALFLALTPAPATAYFWTGNEMLEACSKRMDFAEGLCLGDVAATFDAMLALGYECRNMKGVTRQQIRDVVVRSLEQNPEQRHMPATFQTILAIQKAFGCKRK